MNRRDLLRATGAGALAGFAGLKSATAFEGRSWDDVIMVSVEIDQDYEWDEDDMGAIKLKIQEMAGRQLPVLVTSGVKDLRIHTCN